MKVLIIAIVSCLSFKIARSQAKDEKNSITLTSNRYTQQINKDSLNTGETTFRYIDIKSVNGTTERSNKKDKQDKSSTFVSTAFVITQNDNKQ